MTVRRLTNKSIPRARPDARDQHWIGRIWGGTPPTWAPLAHVQSRRSTFRAAIQARVNIGRTQPHARAIRNGCAGSGIHPPAIARTGRLRTYAWVNDHLGVAEGAGSTP